MRILPLSPPPLSLSSLSALSDDDDDDDDGDDEDSQLRANAAVDELCMLILAQAAELFDAPRADLHRPWIDRGAPPKRPEDYTAADALRNFHFAHADLRTLITAIGIPDPLPWIH